MKYAYQLAKSGSDYCRAIGIKHDMSNERRERQAELKKEAKAKNNAEEGNFIYLVRGLPWERHLVKIRKGGGAMETGDTKVADTQVA